jgi:signal transduction histidine kinase
MLNIFKKLSLQGRFMLGLSVIAVLLGGLFAGIFSFHMKSIVVEEVQDKSNIILDQVNAVQSYVRRVLRPKMYAELKDEQFVIEAMSSSYVSRKVMESASHSKDFSYSRVAENARNPKNDPSEVQRQIIRHFRKHPDQQRYEKLVSLKGKKHHLTARPVVFSKGCMHCHGSPEDAPEELIAKYGSERGFGHSVGEVAGLVSVAFPMEHTVQSIKDATVGYLILYLFAVLFFISLIHLQFRQLVVFNLKRLSSIFYHHFPERREATILEGQRDSDEVEDIVHSFKDLASHLSQARAQLHQYAQNLEQMVEDRTTELHDEAAQRRADVHLFVHLLDGLRSSRGSEELIQKVLHLIAERLQATRATYFCTQFSDRVYTWPETDSFLPLPEGYLDFALSDEIHVTDNLVCIPVKFQEQLWGVLTLELSSQASHHSASTEILLALGQQMAIALENIQSFHSLMHQKERLEAIFEGISDPLLLMDAQESIVLANQGAQTIFQDQAPDSVGTNILSALRVESGDTGAPTSAISRSISQGKAWYQEVEILGKRTFLVTIYPIPGTYQEDRGLAVCYFREVTAEKRMMKQLQRTDKLSAVGKLASGLAHEINNPLGTILCYANLLKKDLPEDKPLEDLQIIERHAKRAQIIVQDLLDFARPKTTSAKPCDINELIRTHIQFVQARAEKKRVRIQADLEDDLPTTVTDISALEQILSNLLLNALEALDGDGWISVSSAWNQHSQQIAFSVEDSGPGIARDSMQSIFDPFYTTKDVGEGTGLGLAVVYGLIEEIGGQIEVENATGAKFTVSLPYRPSS